MHLDDPWFVMRVRNIPDDLTELAHAVCKRMEVIEKENQYKVNVLYSIMKSVAVGNVMELSSAGMLFFVSVYICCCVYRLIIYFCMYEQ